MRSINMKKQKVDMPAPRTPSRSKKEKSVETEYLEYFVPQPAPLWSNSDENYSLEQPSPFKWVPSETTYGVGHLAAPVPINA